MILILIGVFGGIGGHWLEDIKADEGFTSIGVTEEGGREGGKWKLKATGWHTV